MPCARVKALYLSLIFYLNPRCRYILDAAWTLIGTLFPVFFICAIRSRSELWVFSASLLLHVRALYLPSKTIIKSELFRGHSSTDIPTFRARAWSSYFYSAPHLFCAACTSFASLSKKVISVSKYSIKSYRSRLRYSLRIQISVTVKRN